MENSLKVIQVSASDFGGGVETVVRAHHQELMQQGHQTQLLVGRQKGNEPGTTRIPFRSGPKGFLRTARWVQQHVGLENLYSPSFRAIEESFAFEPDILHFHSLHGADSYAELSVLRKLSRKYPVVITLHDFWLMTGHCGYPLGCDGWLRGCGRCPDLNRYPKVQRDATRPNFSRKQLVFQDVEATLTVPSHWLKAQVERSPILGSFPVTVVANSVDTQTFSPAQPETISGLRSKFGIAGDETAVLMIANNLNNLYKGIEDGIAAINQIADTKIKVLIVGQSSETLSQQLHVTTTALPYTTSKSDLANYYRIADLLLMPSRCETFGLVAAEAMACGTPVIAFDAGALPEVIGDRSSGVVVAGRDTSEMARQIDSLARDPDRRARMSRASIDRVNDLFQVSEHTRGICAVYRLAIENFQLRCVENVT